MAPAELEAQLAGLCQRARSAWSELRLDEQRFVAYVAAHCSRQESVELDLGEVHTDDLYLACACLDRIPGAIERFEQRHLAGIADLVRAIDPSPAFIEEVKQLMREKLFIGGANTPPKIDSYSGRGPLAGWVAIVAQRVALSLRRSLKTEPQASLEPSLVEALPARGDPELDYLQARYRVVFRDALAHAISTLTDRQRMLLRLHVIDRMSHEEIAAVYSVSQSTVTRWIAAAREAILRATQDSLRAHLDADTAEFHSLLAVVQSHLDLSIARLLGGAEM